MSKREEQCRLIFQSIFKRKTFPKVRSNFLRNLKTNRCLELDGYNKKLKLAFEYDGYQHYIYPNKFHKSYKQFLYQKYRDRLKDRLCRRNKVTLIRIKYNISNIEGYIKKRLRRRGFVKRRRRNLI